MKRKILNTVAIIFFFTFGLSIYGCPNGSFKDSNPSTSLSTMEKKPSQQLPPIRGDQISAPNLPFASLTKSYTSKTHGYNLIYPSAYTLEENKTYQIGTIVVKIQGAKGKIAIYSQKDLPVGPIWIFPQPGDGGQGWLPTEPAEELKPVISKDGTPIGIWLFYDKNDSKTKAELQKIVDSIKFALL